MHWSPAKSRFTGLHRYKWYLISRLYNIKKINRVLILTLTLSEKPKYQEGINLSSSSGGYIFKMPFLPENLKLYHWQKRLSVVSLTGSVFIFERRSSKYLALKHSCLSVGCQVKGVLWREELVQLTALSHWCASSQHNSALARELLHYLLTQKCSAMEMASRRDLTKLAILFTCQGILF